VQLPAFFALMNPLLIPFHCSCPSTNCIVGLFNPQHFRLSGNPREINFHTAVLSICRQSPVSTVTKLRTRQRWNRNSILDRGIDFSFVLVLHICSRVHPTPYPIGLGNRKARVSIWPSNPIYCPR
jgi:hypothetical protein